MRVHVHVHEVKRGKFDKRCSTRGTCGRMCESGF